MNIPRAFLYALGLLALVFSGVWWWWGVPVEHGLSADGGRVGVVFGGSRVDVGERGAGGEVPSDGSGDGEGVYLTPEDESWVWIERGAERRWVLALDEAVERGADGKDRSVVLNPPATRETLASRLKDEGGGAWWPVLYEEGKPRTVAYRRIVTKGLTLKLGGVAVSELPGRLQVRERPVYAPEYVLVEAADPLSALAVWEKLQGWPGVELAEVQLAQQKALRALPNDPRLAAQWHLKFNGQSGAVAGTDVNVEGAWNYGGTGGVKGSGVRIGIVDDGLETAHEDLAANVDTVNDKDWNGNDADPNPGSGDDHGTACAGNAAARGNNSLGVSGTAPEATLVGMRLIAAATTDAQEAEALNYLPQLIEIKSNSWGPNDDGSTLEAPGPLTKAALANAAMNGRGGKGTIFLWAGGNGREAQDNSNYDGYANSIYTIAIGATDSQGGQAYYSESGANLVVSAPSSGTVLGITTTDRSGTAGYNSVSSASGGNYTADFGGTSSATPTAAGVVALMLQKNPNLGWRDVQEILIRTASKVRLADSDWADNAAGFHFNHKFGAGLIDATAAVNLAGTWSNLAAAVRQEVVQSGLSVAVPDYPATGVTRTFGFQGSNLRCEQVVVTLSATHGNRGELEVTLTSPSGMVSRLAERHDDFAASYSAWEFSTVRHWGENSAGVWTLKVTDRVSGTTGTLTEAKVTIYGTPGTPINPGPVVQIVSPQDGAVFSPGAVVEVQVDASDLNADGSPGSVVSVQLFDAEVLVGTDSSPPFAFTLTPSLGDHVYRAVAMDAEGEVSTSGAVNLQLLDQAPVVEGVSLSAEAQSFADEDLEVDAVSAVDPEGQSLVYEYRWEYSTDGIYWQDAGVYSALLIADAGRAGKLWRCGVRASDGVNRSAEVFSAAVNVLGRPVTVAAEGGAYEYASGLVLRGTDSTLTKQVILNEFSQGVAGTSEWVELLVLKTGSLRGWKLKDGSGNTLTFADSVEWDAIPAGTLVVIYHGASKDSLLPVDDVSPAGGSMVVSSLDTTRFTGVWPGYGNGGDAVILTDAAGQLVSGISYGTSSAFSPNLGAVSSGRAAYFTGYREVDAGSASFWKITASTVVRQPRALNPPVVLSGGTYSQDFSVTPGVSGTAYPDGWTCYQGNGVEDATMGVWSPTTSSGGNYNFGSKIGIMGSSSSFDTGSMVMVLANTSGWTGLKISYDVVKVLENPRSHDLILEYSLSGPTSGFSAVNGGSYTSGNSPVGSTPFMDLSLPSAIENQSGPVYLRWRYAPSAEPGSGARDALAVDNVLIRTGGGGGTAVLSLTVAPSSFAESAGPLAATATLGVSSPVGGDLIVQVASSDVSAATVPATVVIPAGQTAVTFAVAAVDDEESDGPQTAVLTASAPGYVSGSFTVTVTDNDPSLEGVTPGSGNTAGNQQWITDLRGGVFSSPALFRLGGGTVLPHGLSLDATNGIISGTLQAGTAGSYPVVIERYNTLGEVVSQSFVLVIQPGAAVSYANWVSGYSLSAAGKEADPDMDGVKNVLEYYLVGDPGQPDAGILPVAVRSGAEIRFSFWRRIGASDVSAVVEWSDTLQSGSWTAVGGLPVVMESQLVRERVEYVLPAGSGKRFIRLRVE